jgi:predicted nucleotidyltransferase
LPEDIDARIDALAPDLERAGVRLAYLFGSSVRGGASSLHRRDVDVAVLLPDGGDIVALAGRLIDLLGTDRVDLVDLARAPLALRFEVVAGVRCLYACSEDGREVFELDVLLDQLSRQKSLTLS